MKKGISFQQVDFAYPRKKIFENLSLDIPPGLITVIMGPSGSGKSTILRLIAGFETPAKGRLSILGRLASENGRLVLPPYRRQLGFVFQDGVLWPHMTVEENILFGLRNQKPSQYMKEWIEKLRLTPFLHRYPDQLSGGQQQLAAIARAVLPRPSILLMDEPMSNVDVLLKKDLLQWLKTIHRQWLPTMVYVTHNHREAFYLADHIVVMNEGKILESGPPEQIKQTSHPWVKLFMEL